MRRGYKPGYPPRTWRDMGPPIQIAIILALYSIPCFLPIFY